MIRRSGGRAVGRSVTLSAAKGLILALCTATSLAAQTRIGDVTTHDGEVPVRLVGYGLVVGLDGTGDRSFGTTGSVQTVRSVTNLLRRFNVEVPAERLRLRNVAAVLVTAEVSPYLRPGGRFEVQVSSLGDATSLAGGTLWITPLVSDPDGPAMGTAQGPMAVVADDRTQGRYRIIRAGSGRITEGGVLEATLPSTPSTQTPRLILKQPDLGMAVRVAAAIKAAHGDSAAKAEDPGSVTLKAPTAAADNLPAFLASIDTLPVEVVAASRIVIDSRSGVVVAGGDVRVGPAVVSLRGITVRVRTDKADSTALKGEVALGSGATVQDVAAGLHAMGAAPREVAEVFDALKAAGAIRATVVVR